MNSVGMAIEMNISLYGWIENAKKVGFWNDLYGC